MKVSPLEQKIDSDEKMPNRSKTDWYVMVGIHTLVVCLGLGPYKIRKETGEISFKWFSFETISSLTRLVIFNSPFSILPTMLMAFFGPGEWNQEEKSGSANSTNETLPKTTVILAVAAVEYISCYSYFILSRVAKSYAFYAIRRSKSDVTDSVSLSVFANFISTEEQCSYQTSVQYF